MALCLLCSGRSLVIHGLIRAMLFLVGGDVVSGESWLADLLDQRAIEAVLAAQPDDRMDGAPSAFAAARSQACRRLARHRSSRAELASRRCSVASS